MRSAYKEISEVRLPSSEGMEPDKKGLLETDLQKEV